MKTSLKMVYKIHSRELRKAGWNLTRPLSEAMKVYPDCVVSIGDSQVLRWIEELNNVTDGDSKIEEIKRRIRKEKKKPKGRESRTNIRELYNNLYSLQFIKDYVSIIMDRDSDYERANKGFTINGIHFKRYLGTNGGIKKSTIVYVNEELYPELKKRLDNGRDPSVPLVPAKLEAYQALVCSASVPLPLPRGFIVVNDCVTHFKEDVILLNDENPGEPVMEEAKDYEIEHTDSDGCGLMSPEYSRKVNEWLNGDGEHTISGINTRLSFEKGMLFTFDFCEFADKIGRYEVTDAWGCIRDVRDADVILTTSMLKLWDCYPSWEVYYQNCMENHYQFSSPKATPDELENVRDTNYQFLQSYNFTDKELDELCQPTIDEIQEVMGMDWRKSILFLAGYGLKEENIADCDPYIKALMIDRRMINDSFIRKRIYNMIRKRIEGACRGVIRINANYAMISGDPYALCQSMFGLEVTGLLKAGELYHKYWIDKGATELACFRAPMTCHNNIRKLRLHNDEQTSHWYQYITTAIILNAFDTTCDAMNGSDKDGDTNMDTDNPIILKKTLNSPTIVCIQRRAEKKLVTEEDLIQSNKLAFNDDIGAVTNRVTSMIERQAGFSKNSKEYKILSYRIMCGQLYQQNTIDRAKGIVAKPMPDYWYDIRKQEGDGTEEKRVNQRIAASSKPYFMIYVYPQLKKQLSDLEASNNADMRTKFSRYRFNDVEEMRACGSKTREMEDFLYYYDRKRKSYVGENPCVINRICWKFEKVFPSYHIRDDEPFDYRIMKSGVQYTKADFNAVYDLYEDYKFQIAEINRKARETKQEKESYEIEETVLFNYFRMECEKTCPNEDELCDIVLDICYENNATKKFAWEICEETILKNLLKKNDNIISYPSLADDNGDFEYCGMQFVMKKAGGDGNDYIK